MELFVQITSIMLSVVTILLAGAGIKAYIQLGGRFYLWFSIAFTLMAINDVIGRTLRYLVLNNVVAYDAVFRDNKYINLLASLRLEFLGPGSMIIILTGLLLHLLRNSQLPVVDHGVEQVEDAT